jgi:hypothetical protein
VIKIGRDDIFVIHNRQRRWVPNPETLEALGITHDRVNNKGASDAQLLAIPKGQDIPDVKIDPVGFKNYKDGDFAKCRPNAVPTSIVTTVAPPSVPCYKLTIRLDPGGAVRILTQPDCAGGLYKAGSKVNLRAEPQAGVRFLGWILEGGSGGNSLDLEIVMNGNKTVSAVFYGIVTSTPTPTPKPVVVLVHGWHGSPLHRDEDTDRCGD